MRKARPLRYFYPRPPRGGRPFSKLLKVDFTEISIHALREEGDSSAGKLLPGGKNFYPRPPRGGRHQRLFCMERAMDFYPRPPRGGRPSFVQRHPVFLIISIHALREEGDAPRLHRSAYRRNFYPRPPRGGRPEHPVSAGVIPCISIHALREEGDITCDPNDFWAIIFLSTPSARRATFPLAAE